MPAAAATAAALLLGKRPQKFFVASEVKCVQFYADRVSKPMADHQIYRDDEFEQADQATRFAMSRISNGVGTRETGDTAELPTKFELPYDAVKETGVNPTASALRISACGYDRGLMKSGNRSLSLLVHLV